MIQRKAEKWGVDDGSPIEKIIIDKVYEFWFNECIYDSAAQCISLHKTREGAEKAMERHKKETEDEWKRVGLKIPDYMIWGIEERTIEE